MNRGDLIREILSIWDETLRIAPDLAGEYAIAVEWLTKTWTVEELNQAIRPIRQTDPNA